MLQTLFHAWERRLASVTRDRVVRPFDWGLEWMSYASASPDLTAGTERNGAPDAGVDALTEPEAAQLSSYVSRVMRNTDAFYTPAATSDYVLGPLLDGEQWLTFPSAMNTPHRENNTVYGRLFHPRDRPGRRRAAVVVLPQWNSDADGHVGLSRLLTMNGLTAMRLSLPYHDRRMPPELHRADYIVSSNVTRTLQVCRQAVLDARRAIAWLHARGYERIGMLGSSLGSCLALLTTAHEPLVNAQALNHISPYFADVVWRGISTEHVRQGLDGHIELDLLRQLWQPISPANFLERLRNRKTLLVYARYDLTFPVDLSRELVGQFETQGIPHERAVLTCGHYTTGISPFKFVDGWILSRFLRQALL
jgi:hypothetical protein